MLRRDMFRGALAGAGALFGMRAARAAEEAGKAVYHLSDSDKVVFVLGNIRNHYEGTGNAGALALVVHGPALGAFRKTSGEALVASQFEALAKRGLQAYACANTLRGMALTLGDLTPGFALAEKGGVVKLAELQRAGFAYLRP